MATHICLNVYEKQQILLYSQKQTKGVNTLCGEKCLIIERKYFTNRGSRNFEYKILETEKNV
jgi:hypothetical protein